MRSDTVILRPGRKRGGGGVGLGGGGGARAWAGLCTGPKLRWRWWAREAADQPFVSPTSTRAGCTIQAASTAASLFLAKRVRAEKQKGRPQPAVQVQATGEARRRRQRRGMAGARLGRLRGGARCRQAQALQVQRRGRQRDSGARRV
jgi:hypothetical protein